MIETKFENIQNKKGKDLRIISLTGFLYAYILKKIANKM